MAQKVTIVWEFSTDDHYDLEVIYKTKKGQTVNVCSTILSEEGGTNKVSVSKLMKKVFHYYFCSLKMSVFK